MAYRKEYIIDHLNLDHTVNLVPFIDILGCRCTLRNISVYIFVIYIAPRVTSEELEIFFEYFEQSIIHKENVIIMGDFNVTNFVNRDLADPKYRTLDSFINFSNLNQQNTIRNIHGRILDLIITDVNCSINRDSVPLIKEDDHHPSLIINFKLDSDEPGNFPANRENKSYNFRKANYLGLYNDILNTDWSFLDNYNDVNIACEEFYGKLYSLLDVHVPLYRNVRPNKYPKWFTPEIKNNIKLKDHYRKKYKKSGNNLYFQEFSRLRSLIKNLTSVAYNNYLASVESNISIDPKNFWSYIQDKKACTRIPGKMYNDTSSYDDPRAIVNGFADYFSNVYIPVDASNTASNAEDFGNFPCINVTSFNETDILAAIKKLANKMTSGHDRIPSFLVKDCARAFVPPLLAIFNLILNSCTFPDVWKLSRVCPILKCDKADNIQNYRSIVILCNFAKVFEICLYTHIFPQVKPLISPQQHGFIERRSTVSNLVEITQVISNTLDNRGQVDVIYTDFSKAFDKIVHSILLNKLDYYGFSNPLVSLMTSYLGDRKLYVSYNGYNSNLYIATSGVPQGSNLGPLLFILFINDLTTQIKCGSLLFADDLKLYATVSNVNDCLELQLNINLVEIWCNQNKLFMNVSKCKVCSYTRKSNPIYYHYSFNASLLTRCSSTRDLGIYFDSKLTFNEHIILTTTSALKTLGFIIRNCRTFTDIKALKTLFVSLVRSKLEYGDLIWYPHYDIYINLLERVQRRFLKFLAFKVDGVYPTRGIAHGVLTSRFDIQTLGHRRLLSSLTFLYKLLHNTVDAPILLSMLNFLIPRQNLRINQTFYCDNARTNTLVKSPMYVMSDNFNKIAHLCDINHCSLPELVNVANNYFL